MESLEFGSWNRHCNRQRAITLLIEVAIFCSLINYFGNWQSNGQLATHSSRQVQIFFKLFHSNIDNREKKSG
jgi:hypothetical protein